MADASARERRQRYEANRVRPPLWTVWQGMRQRCNNPKAPRYERYGGRGIRVCKRWDSFKAFVSDMGPRPSALHQMERKNNDGPYDPNNCVWATPKANTRNRSTNRLLPHDGRTQCLSAWADEAGITANALRARLRLGHSLGVCLQPLVERNGQRLDPSKGKPRG